MKTLMAFMILTGAVMAQDFVPAYSNARVEKLALAIGRAEGFGVPGAKPTINRNPGDLKSNGEYKVFRSNKAGWAALHAQLVRIIEGRSQVYTLDTTIAQMGQRYAGGQQWAKNVAKVLGVPESTTLGAWLCSGGTS